jgi:hypothetical protein
MKKIILPIGRIIVARKALNQLMNFTGIDRKKVYWLTRNNDALEASINEWYLKTAAAVFDKYCIEVPPDPFIPANQYYKFKKELVELQYELDSECTYPVDQLKKTFEKMQTLFEKYEKESNAKRGIPVENQKDFNEEMKATALKFEREIEYTEIVADSNFDKVLSQLTGEEIQAIEYMFEEPSVINIFQGGTIQ